MHILLIFFTMFGITFNRKVSYSLGNDAETASNKSTLQNDEDGLADAEKLIQNIRLSDYLIPIHYTLEIQPFLDPDFSFNGSIDIEFLCTKNTKSIILHSKDLQIDENQLRVRKKDDYNSLWTVSYWGFSTHNDFLVLYLNRELYEDAVYVLSISFSGEITDDFAGFFTNSYSDESNITRWVAYTQFYPGEPRKVFPCFDEPALKATFDIIIVRPKEVVSLSNMEIVKKESRDEDWIADYYQMTPPISTHLVAFAICDFQNKTLKTKSGIKLVAWAPESKWDQMNETLNLAFSFFGSYENYFEVHLPINKIDIVLVFESRLQGNRGWGLITLEESISSEFDEITSAIVLAQQIAHQWFGNVISLLWWDNLWFQEGFATYLAYKALRKAKPEWQMEEHMIVQKIHLAMDSDASRFSQPLATEINEPTTVSEVLSEAVLSKAASVIRALITILGEKNFCEGIRSFLMNWKFRSAPQESLWTILTELSVSNGRNIDVKDIIESLTKQAGFPLVEISRNFTKETTSVTQEQFIYCIDIPHHGYLNNNLRLKWEIPVTLLNENQDKNVIWLHKNNVTLDELISPLDKWIIANVKVSGFYIVNYDHKNWLLLKQQLEANHEVFHRDVRLQIISDAFQLARTGRLDYGTALDLTNYIKNEQDYYVWFTITENLKFLADRLKNLCIHRVIAKYYVQKTYHIFKDLWWEENATENILTRKQRTTVIADSCSFGLKECVMQSKIYFKQWKENLHLKEDINDQKFIILCNGLRFGTEDDWMFVFDHYQKSVFKSERLLYVKALTCSNHIKLERLLNYTLTEMVKKQDKIIIFSLITKTQRGAKLAWDFFKKSFKMIKEMYFGPKNLLLDLLTNIVKNFRSRIDITELEEFTSVYTSEFDWETVKFKKMLETAYESVSWFENFKDIVSDWFIKNTDGADTVCTQP